MGFWKSALPNATEGIWGDSLADIMDDTIATLVDEFVAQVGRKPSKAELIAGLEFSLGAYDEEKN